jgi:hypothetical protein
MGPPPVGPRGARLWAGILRVDVAVEQPPAKVVHSRRGGGRSSTWPQPGSPNTCLTMPPRSRPPSPELWTCPRPPCRLLFRNRQHDDHQDHSADPEPTEAVAETPPPIVALISGGCCVSGHTQLPSGLRLRTPQSLVAGPTSNMMDVRRIIDPVTTIAPSSSAGSTSASP